MPTLYLHTGLHKTGTTSLQKVLHDNRAALRAQGVLYPETGLSEKPVNWGHHELAYALRERDKARALWQALRAEADASGLAKILVSSEELSLLPFPGLPAVQPYKLIAEIFKGYDIRLICYLRPQAEMIASLYNHNVKSVGETRDILEFIAQAAPRLEYHSYLNLAAQGLGGAKNILVRRYQKALMKGGDIVADMADLVGFDATRLAIAPRPLNAGLTAEGLAKMLEANRRHVGAPARLKEARDRIIDKHRAPPFYQHALLSADSLRLIEALYRQKNRHIARHFLKSDGELFPVEPAAAAEKAG